MLFLSSVSVFLICAAGAHGTLFWNTTLPIGSGKPLPSDLQPIFDPYLNLNLSASCHTAYYGSIECDSIVQDIGDNILQFASSEHVLMNDTNKLSVSQSDLDIICAPSCASSLKNWEDDVHKSCLGSDDNTIVHQWLGIAWIDLVKTFCLKDLQTGDYCLVEGKSFASFVPGSSSSSIDIDVENTSSICDNSCTTQQLSLYHSSMPKMFQNPSTICPGLNMTGYPSGYIYQSDARKSFDQQSYSTIIISFTILVLFFAIR